MAVNPHSVAMFKEFAACYDDKVAVRALIANNNDVESAVLAYMDDPGQYMQDQVPDRWDESAWNQDRYGNEPLATSNTNADAPHIVVQGPDDFPRSSAPTRPPSRSSNLAEMGAQETGVVGSVNNIADSGKYFGPATRDNYPDSQWALTTVGATVSSAASYPDVEPSQRKRVQGEPVFVKPNDDLEFAPALLSILGQIPMVLQYFLRSGSIADDYGDDAGWWKGSVIQRPLTVDLESPDAEADRTRHKSEEALQEMHRVAGFFCASTRAYYQDAIFKLLEDLRYEAKLNDEWSETLSETVVSLFCQGWTVAAERVDDSFVPAGLFRSRVVECTQEGTTSDIPFYEWGLTLPTRLGESNVSLYDALDESIWKLDTEGTNTAAYWLEQAPHVLLVTVTNQADGAKDLEGVGIPLVLYLDRYLKENVTATKEMRKNTAALRELHDRTRQRMRKLVTFRHPKASTDNLEALLSGSAKFLSVSDEEFGADKDGDVAMDCSSSPSADSELVAMLESIQGRIRSKLAALKDEQKRIAEQFRKLSGIFTDPRASENAPTHRYTLTGVATSEQDMYMLCPPGPEGSMPCWWHVQYTSRPELKRERTHELEVVQAARQNSNKVMFVYASDEIRQPVNAKLPPSLQTFIQRDNEAFAKEVQEYENSHWSWAVGEAGEPPPYNFDANGPFVPDIVSDKSNAQHFHHAHSQATPQGESLQGQVNFTSSSSSTWEDYYPASAPSSDHAYIASTSANPPNSEQVS